MAVYYSGGWEFGIWGEKDHISQVGIARKAWVLNSADTMHRCRAWAERLFCSRYHYDGMPAGTTSDHAGAAADAEKAAIRAEKEAEQARERADGAGEKLRELEERADRDDGKHRDAAAALQEAQTDANRAKRKAERARAIAEKLAAGRTPPPPPSPEEKG